MIPLKDTIKHKNKPIVTATLIAVNFFIFFYQLIQGQYLQNFVAQFGFIPVRVLSDAPAAQKFLPLFSSIFLHGGWMHLLGNSLYLWIFGDNVEDKLGHFNFLVFYLLCGVVANAAHFIMNIRSPVPAIGASGAIAGVLGAYFVMFPRSRVLTLLPFFVFWQIVEIPAFFFLGFWFIFQFFYGFMSIGGASGVAFWAHIGGFLAGITYAKLFLRPDYFLNEVDDGF